MFGGMHHGQTRKASSQQKASQSQHACGSTSAVEEWDFSDLEDMVTLSCSTSDCGDDEGFVGSSGASQTQSRTHATELAGLFTLRVLLRMPRLATLGK